MLNEHVMDSTIGTGSVEISSVDISLEAITISLNEGRNTGTLWTISVRITAWVRQAKSAKQMSVFVINPSIRL